MVDSIVFKTNKHKILTTFTLEDIKLLSKYKKFTYVSVDEDNRICLEDKNRLYNIFNKQTPFVQITSGRLSINIYSIALTIKGINVEKLLKYSHFNLKTNNSIVEMNIRDYLSLLVASNIVSINHLGDTLSAYSGFETSIPNIFIASMVINVRTNLININFHCKENM